MQRLLPYQSAGGPMGASQSLCSLDLVLPLGIPLRPRTVKRPGFSVVKYSPHHFTKDEPLPLGARSPGPCNLQVESGCFHEAIVSAALSSTAKSNRIRIFVS